MAGKGTGRGNTWDGSQSNICPRLVRIQCYLHGKASQRIVILASAGKAEAPSPDLFMDKRVGVVRIESFSSQTTADQFTDFFTTYNRTACQERVRDLLRV